MIMLINMEYKYTRPLADEILKSFKSPKDLIQIIIGARQVGKSTIAMKIAKDWDGPVIYATADEARPPSAEWIIHNWELSRRSATPGGKRPLLIIDEVQKVPGWGDTVKGLWDRDRFGEGGPNVLLLGSSALMVAKGSSESLAGRFLLHRCAHWSFPECAEAFAWDLDKWLFFGGYPGASQLIGNEVQWRSYINDSLIETALARDVMAMQTVAKPTLLRHLFGIASVYAGQIVSYTKMLGQLQDAGNVTTLANYLRLLSAAFLASGLERFSGGEVRKKGSSPKLVMWNNALITAPSLMTFEQARADHSYWGRLVENAVGAHLLNCLQGVPYEITYWRERDYEVDYIVRSAGTLWAIEVKSGRVRKMGGMAMFTKRNPEAKPLIIGYGGIPLEEFFSMPAIHWVG